MKPCLWLRRRSIRGVNSSQYDRGDKISIIIFGSPGCWALAGWLTGCRGRDVLTATKPRAKDSSEKKKQKRNYIQGFATISLAVLLLCPTFFAPPQLPRNNTITNDVSSSISATACSSSLADRPTDSTLTPHPGAEEGDEDWRWNEIRSEGAADISHCNVPPSTLGLGLHSVSNCAGGGGRWVLLQRHERRMDHRIVFNIICPPP